MQPNANKQIAKTCKQSFKQSFKQYKLTANDKDASKNMWPTLCGNKSPALPL